MGNGVGVGKRWVVVAVIAAISLGVAPRLWAGAPIASDWPQPGFDAGQTHGNANEQELGAAEAEALELVGSRRFREELWGPPAIVGGSAYLYMLRDGRGDPDEDPVLLRVDLSTGRVLWRTAGEGCPYVKPHVTSSHVLTGASCSQSDPGGVHARRLTDGRPVWGSGYASGGLALHRDRLVSAHGPYGAYGEEPWKLVARDASTGQVKWDRTPLGDMPFRFSGTQPGGVLAVGSTVYTIEGGRLVARKLSGGKIRWRWRLPSALSLDAATFYALFLNGSQGVVALNPMDRSIRWSSPETRVAAVLDGTVFLQAADGFVARDVGTGEELWRIGSTFTEAIAANGVVYGLDPETDRVVAISAETGAVLDAVPGESMAIAAGRLFVTEGRWLRSYS
ncbi:MAG: PQQ-binding-like beta-propeller repeat protein [Actinomycetota bacterium]